MGAIQQALLMASGVVPETFPAQLFIDGNGRSDGTDITAAELNAGDRGTIPGGGNYLMNPGGGVPANWLEWAANQNSRIANVDVGGTVYGTELLSKSIRLDHTYNLSTVLITNLGGSTKAIWTCTLTLGLSATGAALGLCDYLGFACLGAGTRFAVVQLKTGGAPGNTYALNIESNPGLVTTHSNYVTVTPFETYRLVFWVDFASGVEDAILNIYTLAGVLVGTCTVAVEPSTEIFLGQFGQGQTSTEAGKFSHFQDLVFNYSANNTLPYGPI